jgi:hypothetical protein
VRETGLRMKGGAVRFERSPEKEAILMVHKRKYFNVDRCVKTFHTL